VGQRRGLFSFGELLVLVYNFREDKVLTVQSLRGYSIFARFVELQDYTGLSLEELHHRAAGAGRKEVLIQALDAVKKHLGDAVAPKTVTETKAAKGAKKVKKAKPEKPAKKAKSAKEAKLAKKAEAAAKATTEPAKATAEPVKAMAEEPMAKTVAEAEPEPAAEITESSTDG